MEVKVEGESFVDAGKSLAKEFGLRYMGKMMNLELYNMKVLEGETTISTKGVSRGALVKRMEEVKKQFKLTKEARHGDAKRCD